MNPPALDPSFTALRPERSVLQAEAERMRMQLVEADRLRTQASEAGTRAAEAERQAAVAEAVADEQRRSELERKKLVLDLEARMSAVTSSPAHLLATS